jgi:hypothetical protein
LGGEYAFLDLETGGGFGLEGDGEKFFLGKDFKGAFEGGVKDMS